MGKKQPENEPNKKIKSFSAKEFRKQISTQDAFEGIKKFLAAVKESEGHDYILEYLENGGSCLELLQSLELNSTIPPAAVFELITHILLKISSFLPQYQSTAYESCRYILNNYITVINKMINLSSTTPERKACLKLLTSMVAFSPILAKDILIHVNFYSANVELLTKHTGEKDSVRDNFIKFLTAYLVDGHYPALSFLLEKKGFFTSIISGLKFDSADTVSLVVIAMKNFILENPSVSKTAKMKTFNTIVIRDIVNLYNWKGLAGFKSDKKNKNITVAIDEIDKSKVNQTVHEFLLILCTNHKYGIIFKDHLVGLGKKNQNALMYTVLESLDRPWEHSYASELVIKICAACPDLTKTLWGSLKSFLEPRLSQKWIIAIKFAVNLVKELKPTCIEFCIKELNEFQLFQIIQCLVLPLPILKTIISENNFDSQPVKQYTLSLLLEMLKSLNQYKNVFKNHFPIDKQDKLDLLINKYVSKNFPNATNILNNWDRLDEDSPLTILQNLSNIIDIINYYKTISPDLLDTTDFSYLLYHNDFNDEFDGLKVKIINLMVDLDPTKFNSDSFIIPLLFKIYYNNPTGDILDVINKLFKNTGIFDGCGYEINIWINGILDLKIYDEKLAGNIVDILKITKDNINDFIEELSIQSESSTKNYTKIIANIIKQTDQIQTVSIKNNYLSPMIVGLTKFLETTDPSKSMKIYINFVLTNLLHLQTKIEPIVHFINKIPTPNSLKNYANFCAEGKIAPLKKYKGRINVLEECSEQLLSNKSSSIDFNAYPDAQANLLDMGIFYLNHDVPADEFIKTIIDNNFDIIDRLLCNAVLINKINFLDFNNTTKFIINVTKHLLESNCDVSKYLDIYREKLLKSVVEVLNSPDINPELIKLLHIYPLDYQQCLIILKKLTAVNYDVINYTINQLTHICTKDTSLQPLGEDIILKLTQLYKSEVFLNYFKLFPHSINYVDDNLFEDLIVAGHFNLAKFLLQKKPSYMDFVRDKIEFICEKKNVLLLLINLINDDDLLMKIYDLISPYLNKAIQKPQKVGQHFHDNYQGLVKLIDVAMPVDKFWSKVIKFDSTEIFHVHLLKTISLKSLNGNITGKEINNIIMTFVHLQVNLFKKKIKSDKGGPIAKEFADILTEIKQKTSDADFAIITKNETLKLYYKYCLKYGISGEIFFLKSLSLLLEIFGGNLEMEDGRLILDMLTSHSEFLEIVLGEYSEAKTEILSLYLVLCKIWPEFMERGFVPLLLASYRARVNKCDRIILVLLKMFESKPEQTHFYDFKPFLWGKSAATHYSVRLQIENALLRQPKTSDVLDILQEDLVTSTITNYPLKDNLRSEETDLLNVGDEKSYDLAFLLPLFSQLLAPEQQVQTYKFTRSGALSLTVVGLSSADKDLRQAACHILARFHYHVDAKQTGKDNLLWIRYVEAVCKGTALLPDFKLNNFAAIYLARMALILTQPNHVMYLPLSQHLTAKSSLDFSTVPELYTFLHSCEVNYKEHRNFTLELLRDGLRNDKDFADFARSMAFKLFSELYTSSISDLDTKLLILEVVKSICSIPMGVRVICEKNSYLTQVYSDISSILKEKSSGLILKKNLEILLKVLEVLEDRHTHFTTFGVVKKIISSELFLSLAGETKRILFEIIFVLQKKCLGIFSDDFYGDLLEKIKDPLCNYWDKYGCDFVEAKELDKDDKCFYVRLFVLNFIKSKVK